MKVAFLVTGLVTGGAEMVLYALVSRLDRSVFSPEIISLRGDGPMRARFEALGVPVHLIGISPALPSPLGLARLVKCVRRLRPDLLQGWMYHGNLAATLCTPLAGGIPVQWSIHNSLYDWRLEKRATALVIRAGAALSGRARKVIYCAEVTARQHEAIGFRPDRTEVIANGFDAERYHPDAGALGRLRAELGVSNSAILAGHVARLHPHKDHRTLFAALARAFERSPRLQAVLVGAGIEWSNPEIAAMAAGLSRERLHLLGPRDDIPRLMAGLDFLISSSVSEAFPMVVGEAMACALPCVVTDVGDSAKLLGEYGAVVPASDADALAQAIVDMACLPAERRAEIGALARRRVVEGLSLDTMVRRYEALFAQAI